MSNFDNLLGINNDDEDGKKKHKEVAMKSATHFLMRGNTYSPIDASALVVVEELPVGTYTVGSSPAGFFYQRIEDFELPQKIYGDTASNSERILNTFDKRPNATGVLLEGEKGSGKSMLLKKISIDARNLGIPTIVINSPFCGDAFNTFIQNLKQPAVICFDEYEKVYDSDSQESLLTILDGTFPSKKLFVLTVNNKWRVDTHMRNRPGRIFYQISFGGLSNEFITEYCQDNLNDKSHIEGVLAVAVHFGKFTFDMLKALVEEMNRYGETAADAMKWLNINPEDSEGQSYEITVMKDGLPLDEEKWETSYQFFNGNPLTVGDWMMYLSSVKFDANGNRRTGRECQLTLNNENIVSFDADTCSYIFSFPKMPEFTAKLTRYKAPPRAISYF